MKIKITFKDPDGVYECIRDAVQETLPDGLSDGESNSLIESRAEQVNEDIKKWVQWGEYVTVEFDTETGESKVLPVRGVV